MGGLNNHYKYGLIDLAMGGNSPGSSNQLPHFRTCNHRSLVDHQKVKSPVIPVGFLQDSSTYNPVINGISRINPLITRVTYSLLMIRGMIHQASPPPTTFFCANRVAFEERVDDDPIYLISLLVWCSMAAYSDTSRVVADCPVANYHPHKRKICWFV